jgi:hypothetical protein
MTRNILRVVSFVLGLCSLLGGAPLYAQTDPINTDNISGYGLRNLANAVIINASPATPSVGDTVHFTVEGSVYDLPHDVITWTVNGKTTASGVGRSSTDATVDSRGSALSVTVTVSDPTWGIASNALTIVPQQVDILYDAPTYVPPFYRGRALPSAGGNMHLQAVARLVKGGVQISNSSITYTWSRNGTVLGSLSGLGKSHLNIDAPNMYGADTISVRASAADDTLSASASVVISNAEPTLELYEDHPLYGVTYFNAFTDLVPASGDITVAAVPYFATITGLNDPSAQYNWLLNDAPLAASSTKKNELTVRADTGSAHLRLDLTNPKNFFLSASSNWKIQFGNSGGSTITKPGASDGFHTSTI